MRAWSDWLASRPVEWSAAVGIASVVIGGFWWDSRRERLRAQALARLALRMGWTFLPKDDAVLTGAMPQANLFARGHAKRATHVLRGTLGARGAVLFDYHCTVGYGRHATTYHQPVVVFQLGSGSLPAFQLCPERWFDKLGAVFGYQDIDVPSNQWFSSAYLLRGQDASAVRAVFGPTVLHTLAARPGWCVEGSGGSLLVYRANRRAKPEELPRFLQETGAIRAALSPESSAPDRPIGGAGVVGTWLGDTRPEQPL